MSSYNFNEQWVRRIVRAVKQVEGMRLPSVQGAEFSTIPQDRTIQFVKCTSEEDDDGFYPGMIQEVGDDGELADPEDEEEGECWLLFVNDEVPTEGAIYKAMCIDQRSDDDLEIFATVEGAGDGVSTDPEETQVILADVYCDEGALMVCRQTYEVKNGRWIAIGSPVCTQEGCCECNEVDPGDGTLLTECCPDDLLPTELTLTITGSSCSGINTTYTLTWSEPDLSWKGGKEVSGHWISVELICITVDDWYLVVVDHQTADPASPGSDILNAAGPDTADCNPFEVEWVGVHGTTLGGSGDGTLCEGSVGTPTFTVTE